MKSNVAVLALMSAAGLASVASAQDQTVVISEIFAPTNQAAGQQEITQEFVEIYNYGTEPVDITGWQIDDLDGQGGEAPSQPFPPLPNGDPRMLMPGEALVLFGRNTSAFNPSTDNADRVSAEIFDAQWGPGVNRLFLAPFQGQQLSNSPAPDNEILAIRDAEGDVVDEANYDDFDPWPGDQPDGNSIAVLGEFLSLSFIASQPFLEGQTPKTLNDNGSAWIRSDVVVNGQLKVNGGRFTVPTYIGVADLALDILTVVPGPGPDALLVTPATNFASPGVIDTTIDSLDCNGGGIDDDVELVLGLASDANQGPVTRNAILDICEAEDCNGNLLIDGLDIGIDQANVDCDFNGVPDECQISATPALDGNGNGRLDVCEQPAVLITEIHYNPIIPDANGEWIEITNISGQNINLNGWGFVKLDLGTDNGFETFAPFPTGLTLNAGASAIIHRSADGVTAEDTIADFRAGWGVGPETLVIVSDPFFLADNASPNNEILGIFAPPAAGVLPGGVAPAFVLVDTCDYDADNTPFAQNPSGLEWPIDAAPFTISLLPPSQLQNPGVDTNGNPTPGFNPQQDFRRSNNFGGNWDHSFAGLNGAFFSVGEGTFYNTSRMQGSPGSWYQGPFETDGSGEVIITEIFMSPNTPAIPTGIFDGETELLGFPQNEWVEIYNTTGSTIDLSGWYLQDEDGRTTAISDGAELAPGEVAVIFGTDATVGGAGIPAFEYACRELAADEFYAAWGGGYQVFAVEGWSFDRDVTIDSNSLANLANNPSEANEVLTLRNAAGDIVDFLNWNDAGSSDGLWPFLATGVAEAPSFSIFLSGSGNFTANGNNNGGAWLPALAGKGSQPEVRTNAVTDFFTTLDDMGMPAALAMEASPGIIPGGAALDLNDIPDFNGCPVPMPGCNPADLSEGFGTLDINDILVFAGAFNAADPLADFSAEFGTFDINDILVFAGFFNAGCP